MERCPSYYVNFSVNRLRGATGLGNGHVIMDSRGMVELSGIMTMPTAGFARLAVDHC